MPKSAIHRAFCFTSILLLSLLVAGCSGDDATKAPAAAGPTPLKVIKAASKDMPYWGEFIGQINAVETVDVRARVAGFLLKKNFNEGRQVKKGELLFVIDPKTFQEDLKQAQSSLAYNQALMNKAEKDFERFGTLLDEGVVSRDEFEGYQTEFATYQAKVNESKAQMENARLQLGYTNIYSPIDGVIGRVQVDVGNLVGQGENTLLATISTVDPVYVNFSVSEGDYLRAKRQRLIQENQDHGKVKLILADSSDYEYDGKYDMIDRAIDSRTGTLGIRVIFPNPDKLLRPGQYAKVRVLIEMVENAVVIPVRGVMDVQGMKSVYKVGEDGKIVSQPVKLGFELKGLTVVEEGLKVGDMVIADGLRRVKAGMEIKPIVVPMEKPQGQPASMGGQPDEKKQDATSEEKDG